MSDPIDGRVPTKKPGTKKPGTRKTIRNISILVGLVMVGFAVLLATRKPVSMQTVSSPLLDKPAPVVSGITLGNKEFSLASYKGRFVLLNFFASWCTPCHAEEKDLVNFASNHTRSVAVVGVPYDDANSSARQFLQSYGANYQAVTDPQGQIALAYGVTSPPQTYLISPKGTILTEIIGPVNLNSLDQLLAIAKSKGY